MEYHIIPDQETAGLTGRHDPRDLLVDGDDKEDEMWSIAVVLTWGNDETLQDDKPPEE